MTKNLLSVLLAVTILFGCQTVGAVIADAKKLQEDVSTKMIEIKNGIDNVVTEAKDVYGTLIEKKQQLEDMVAQINEAVNSINQLLGKTETSEAESENLQITISELRNALNDAETTLNEINAVETSLESETSASEGI